MKFELVIGGLVAFLALSETKTSAAVAVLAHDQAFAPMEAAGLGKSTETLVDCPEVFEAAFVGDFKIDGDMDKDVWKATKPISGFESRNPQRPMEAKSGNVANAEALLKEPQTLMANPSQDAVDAWRLAVGEAIDDLTRK